MTSNTRIGMEFNLPKMKDKIAQFLAHLTGEDLQKLLNLPVEELVHYLSNIMQCEEENVLNLLRQHDQNQELDVQTLAMLWKLVARGVLKAHKHSLGSMPEEVYNQTKFIMAQLGNLARFRAENKCAPSPTGSLLNPYAPIIINRASFLGSHQFSVKAPGNSNIVQERLNT